jgi:hypothetical protein
MVHESEKARRDLAPRFVRLVFPCNYGGVAEFANPEQVAREQQASSESP